MKFKIIRAKKEKIRCMRENDGCGQAGVIKCIQKALQGTGLGVHLKV